MHQIAHDEGIIICGAVILLLLAILLTSFFIAYHYKWPRLMTQIKIQQDNVARKQMLKNGINPRDDQRLTPMKFI